MRVAYLLVPHLAIQVERRYDPSLVGTPVVVGGRPWDEGAVLDCCPQAAAVGVHLGMRLSQAERLCPAARFVPAQEELYRAAHDALVSAANRFTPTVETAGLGFVYVEVSGLERQFGPDAQLARQMVREAIKASALDVRGGVPTRPPHPLTRGRVRVERWVAERDPILSDSTTMSCEPSVQIASLLL
jgi:nucleotidyltransferase/DNA polymerase involved in DNA repair